MTFISVRGVADFLLQPFSPPGFHYLAKRESQNMYLYWTYPDVFPKFPRCPVLLQITAYVWILQTFKPFLSHSEMRRKRLILVMPLLISWPGDLYPQNRTECTLWLPVSEADQTTAKILSFLKRVRKLFLTLQVQSVDDKWWETIHITNTADGRDQIRLISTVALLVTPFAACFIITYGGWLALLCQQWRQLLCLCECMCLPLSGLASIYLKPQSYALV